jgi:hypothetical protein
MFVSSPPETKYFWSLSYAKTFGAVKCPDSLVKLF